MKVTIEMTEQEAADYFKFKKCVLHKREVHELIDLSTRLESLSNMVYKGFAVSEESGDLEIINEGYAMAALRLATKELY